ncbi:MAG: nucleotidyltransferase family protein [Agarilytica sp.]
MVSMIEKPLITSDPVVEAVRAIEASRRRIAVVVSEDGLLKGTVTDGDVRRSLLSGGTLDTPVAEVMNATPLTAPVGSSDSYLLGVMRRGNIMAVPLVDATGNFSKLVHLTDLSNEKEPATEANFAFAVIMAGGEGMRLRPITENIPKPMVEIGGVPLLERQIQRLAKAGVTRIYLSVNYLSHVIEEYFGDGSKLGLDIRYLREQEKLGTGGALSLLPERPDAPIVVMNGDILTTSDFGNLNDFHCSQNAVVTVAAIDYHVNIPFGVIKNDGPSVTGLVEKPSQHFLCNAGMYAVSPEALDLIPVGEPYNMTDLIDSCLEQKRAVSVFPVHEYWSDIGTPADLDKARTLFAENV